MKANELMIGDWVYYDCSYQVKVETIAPGEINRTVDTSFFPIPLTPEILEKNGFEPTLAKSERVWKDNGQEVWLDNEGEKYWANLKRDEYYFEGYIEFVHEFQQALRLCGIEKEITL